MPTQSIDPAPAATAVAQLTDCPLCGTHLDPAHPTECPRCDWTQGYRRQREKPVGNARDIAAVLLTVVPGLGHFYKGHTTLGVLVLLGGILAVFAAAVAATATMGLGLLFVPVYWVAMMLHVFWLEDLRMPAR